MSPPDRPATIDEAVARLVQLARDQQAEDLTPEEWAGVRRLERKLRPGSAGETRFPVGARWAVAALVAAAAACAATLVWRERALTFEVTNATVADGGYIAAGSADASVRFSDQSVLGVERGSRLRVSHLEAHGAQVMLEGGVLHVRIKPAPKATWSLDAGPYVVHVTGTEFDLAWRANEQTLDLSLVKGSVTVNGPLAGGGLKMVAGQHLVASALDGSLSIANANGPAVRLAALEEPPAPVSAAPPGTIVAAPASPAPVPARSTPGPTPAPHADSAWSARVARGDFTGVVQEAERRGLERALSESSPAELAALADAARYARRSDLARRALSAARSRFPGTVRAHDAAFFLGGLAESDKDEPGAIDWYGAYLRESPAGAYASQALGRRMILLQKTGDEAGAQQAASEYLKRFGDEPYAPAAQRLNRAR